MNKVKGFTLIEILVVIAIIGLLVSVVLPNLGDSKKKALDARRISDTQEISKALYAFFLAKGYFPGNHNCWNGSSNSVCATGATRAACDAPLPDVPGGGAGTGYIDGSMVNPASYNLSMQELVDAGFLGAIPHSPGGPGYCYTDTGPNNTTGAIVVTELESSAPTKNGLPPSCRPYSSGPTWCMNDQLSQQYCLCNPY